MAQTQVVTPAGLEPTETFVRAKTAAVLQQAGTILERYALDSSWLTEVMWVQISASGVEGLVITFKDGGPFYYPGGTRDHLHRLKTAASPGGTFHTMTDIYSYYAGIVLVGELPQAYKAPQMPRPGAAPAAPVVRATPAPRARLPTVVTRPAIAPVQLRRPPMRVKIQPIPAIRIKVPVARPGDLVPSKAAQRLRRLAIARAARKARRVAFAKAVGQIARAIVARGMTAITRSRRY